jgi:hypothetical protein
VPDVAHLGDAFANTDRAVAGGLVQSENAMQAAVLQGQDAKQSLTNAENIANKQITDDKTKLGG